MNVDTGAFRALIGRLGDLEAEVAGLRYALTGSDGEARTALLELGRAVGHQEAMAEQAARRRDRRPRPRYLQVMPGGG